MDKCNPLLLTTGLTHSLDSTEYGRAFFDSYSFGCLNRYHRKIFAHRHKPMSVYVDLGYKKSLERQERTRIRRELREKERRREMERLRRIRIKELKKQEEARERRRLKRLEEEEQSKPILTEKAAEELRKRMGIDKWRFPIREEPVIEQKSPEDQERENRGYEAIIDDLCKKIVWQYRRGNR